MNFQSALRAAFWQTWDDRGTYFARVLWPLVLLLGLIFFGILIAMSDKEGAMPKVGFIGQENAPLLVERMTQRGFEIQNLSNQNELYALLEKDSIQIGVLVGGDFKRRLGEGRDATVSLYFDSQKNRGVDGEMTEIVETFGAKILRQRLDSLQLDQQFIEPLVIEKQDSYNWMNDIPRYISSFLPFLMVLFAFFACVFSSFDLFNDKNNERPSIYAKWLIGSGLGLDTAIIAAFGLYAVFQFHPALAVMYKNLITGFITIKAVCWIWVAMLPLVLFFVVWLSLLRKKASSYKRAQNIIQSFKIFILLSFALIFMPGMSFESLKFLPGANVVALGSLIVLGKWTWGQLFTVYAVLLIGAAVGAMFQVTSTLLGRQTCR